MLEPESLVPQKNENSPNSSHTSDNPGELIDAAHPPRLEFAVVGVGASAGGLEAYTELLQALPADTGMAFVFIQHLSPQYESMMADLLSKHTAMPVHQVDDGMVIRPNSVYVIRPGHTMTIAKGKLRLGESLLAPGHRRPVDDFFRSLAEEQRERAIAILLSGMGSNGTAGAQAIKAVGGYCIAQDPDSAKYPSMPRSLIESGLADAILRIPEMPEAIIRYAAHRYARAAESAALPVRETKALTEMLAVLRTRAHHDFTGYKKPTIIRRIERRMGLNQVDTMNEYSRYLRQTPAEVTALCDDLMIHVTGFFRDPDAWAALDEHVIRPLVAEREDGSSIRAWVSACSTGEEAYTLAILLDEAADAAGKNFDVKIFATDTAERSLLHARAGTFPGGIESDLSEQRLLRFFDKDDSFYRIKKEMRERVVFAPQNILQDPPFSRLDICTCRNLLIYLEPDVQRRVLSLLHFGLREGGALFLGTSETLGAGFDAFFQPIDKKWRLFRRVGPTRHGAVDFPVFPLRIKPLADESQLEGRPLSRASVQQIANRILLDEHTPAAVVLDRDGSIVYFHGNTDRFLDQPRGEPTREIMTLAKESIRGALRIALQRAAGSKDAVIVRDGLMDTPEGRMRIQIKISPLEKRGVADHYLVSFLEQPEPPPAAPSSDDHTEKQLTEELARMRDELQSAVEELQTSNEEMKASAEETTSINEELQSTNEELETSKEELQSLNEELTTVNAQLQAKMEEIERTGNDLASLLSSTDIAVLFLDTQFRIRRYTPAVTKLFDLIPSDIGRPLNDLARKFNDDQLLIDARSVLDRLLPIEKEIPGETRRWYVRRVLPYRTTDNRIDGVVITFVDVTELRRALQAKRELEDRLLWSLQASGMGDWELECADRRFSCAARGRELFDIDEKRGDSFEVLLDAIHPDDRAHFVRAIERAEDPTGNGAFSLEFRVLHPNGGTTWVESRGAVAFGDSPGGRVPLRLRGILADTTERKLAEGVLREAKRQAEAANDAKDQFLATVSHELRTPLAGILLWAKLLLDENSSAEQHTEGLHAITRAARTQQKLVEDLLDSARISAGKLRLDLRSIDFATLVRGAVDSIQPAARSRGIQLNVDVDADVAAVQLDPDRIEQVILNLLNNAIKFTSTGERIFVGVRRHGDNVELRITDTGQGISPENLPHIFNRFNQAGTPSRRTTSGLGLGLAICRQIVELHHGAISAASAGVGKGATFTVILPLPRVAPVTPPAAVTQAPPSIAGLHLLLIEDDVTTRNAMNVFLTRAGATVTTASTAAEGIAAFQQQRPDIILSDIGLPDADGFSLLRQIRAFESTTGQPPVPAIALTAYTHEKDRLAATQSGFNHHLPKPIDPTELLHRLHHLHDDSRSTSEQKR